MSAENVHIVSRTAAALQGDIEVPGDKSISHRALILGAIAEGTTEIHGLLESLDCLSTWHALRQLGVTIERDDTGLIKIIGTGLYGLKAPSQTLDFGNSGTAIRLMTGLLCAQKFPSTLSGDESLQQRPMRRITDPLHLMGADIHTDDGTPPLEISPVSNLNALEYRLSVASAQLKSCLLLAALYTQGKTMLTGEIQTRDHTEKMLTTFGCRLVVEDNSIMLEGGFQPQASSIQVPGDLSSAAFFIVAATLVPDSDLLIRNVGINETRNGVLQILQAMGADIEVRDRRRMGVEPVADIRVRYARLKGVVIPASLVKNAVDEFPILFIAAACAEGKTELSGAAELRVKESDRIATMTEGLLACGVKAVARADGILIEGGDGFTGGTVNSYGDHRIAMAFAIAGAVSSREITIADCANIQTSFPNFVNIANAIRMNVCEAV